VSWAVRGLQTGDADLWVRDGEPAGTAADVWTHEYVHTRQAYRTEASGQWITEASATHYAALFALDRGAADFDAFERTLARGEREPDASAVLSNPTTWDGHADYTKGALVAGEIDRRLRAATDGAASLATVLRELNEADEPVTNDRLLLDTVEAAAAEGADDATAAEIRDEAERLTTTRATTETWDRDTHAAAFGETPAQVGYGLADDGVRATGEYRNRTVARDPVELVVGESLEAAVVASNTGGATGSYDLSLSVDGEPVANRSGALSTPAPRRSSASSTASDPRGVRGPDRQRAPDCHRLRARAAARGGSRPTATACPPASRSSRPRPSATTRAFPRAGRSSSESAVGRSRPYRCGWTPARRRRSNARSRLTAARDRSASADPRM